MTTKHVLIGARIMYLILMAAGGAGYYAVVQHQTQGENAMPFLEQVTGGGQKEGDAKEPGDGEEAKRREAEKKAAAEEAARRLEAAKQREKQMEELVSGMQVITRGGVTYYSYHHDEHPMSGVYLRPFIAERDGDCVLKNDVYYYSSLEDENYGWLHADRLDVNADGYAVTLAFDAGKRRDRLGKGAENVTENYVTNVDAVTLQMLKAVGNASQVTLRFYQEGTAGAVSTLGRADIRRVHDMVTLYELMQAEKQGS